jgi:hypothetical protein
MHATSITTLGLLALGLTAFAPTGYAAERESGITVTPRLSLGLVAGISQTDDELETILDPGDEHTTNGGSNIEIPVEIAFRGEGPWYFILTPSLAISGNTNDFKGANGESAEESFAAVGVRVYTGVGYQFNDYCSIDLTPFLGVAAVAGKYEESGADSVDSDGTITQFGATLGGYVTWKPGFQLGARLGFISGTGSVEYDGGDSYDIDQSGALLAVDLGWQF